MTNGSVKRGPLPSLALDRSFMVKLWDELSHNGKFLWTAKVGTGGDLLGKQEERPEQEITEWNELVELLESLPRIDSLNITVEIPDKGVIGIVFKNYNPAGGVLAVSSNDEKWLEKTFNSLTKLFFSKKENFQSWLYTRLGFGVVQTLIPLSIAFVVVMAAASFIPSHIRHSSWLGWITAGTLICTLRLAYTISDKLIIYVMKNYPYIRWLS